MANDNGKWKKPTCNHEWVERILRESNFQVAYGAIRECKLCGTKQCLDYLQGWTSGPWVDVKQS